MKAIQVNDFGSAEEVIKIENIPIPKPSKDETSIAVRAVGLNPVDLMAIAGQFQYPVSLPLIPGFEAAGQVVEVGTDLTSSVKVEDGISAYPLLSSTFA